jgi:hypothetical protein
MRMRANGNGRAVNSSSRRIAESFMVVIENVLRAPGEARRRILSAKADAA